MVYITIQYNIIFHKKSPDHEIPRTAKSLKEKLKIIWAMEH
jgi:hypothetical protein